MTRQVPDPGEREVERPRDRRRGQGQHVDLATELLEALLGGHPEALLLVDDDQPEVAEADVLAEQPVRADDDVDRAVGKTGDRRRLGGGRDEARQQADLERERGEPLRERRLVLRGEDGRRHEDGDLLAVLGRLERGPQRDLGLAIADVADHEPVHRPDELHVGLDLGRGAQLVDRLLVREGRLHLGLPRRIGRERVAPRVGARGVQREQLLGQVVDRLADPLLGAQPLGPAEPRQGRSLAARIAADPADLLDRDEDPVAAGERQLEVVAILTGAAAAEHPLVAGHAVIDVDDEVARASGARGCRAGRSAGGPAAGGPGRCRTAPGR